MRTDYNINPDDFQPVKRQVRHIKQTKKRQPSARKSYLHHTPPPYLIPNPYNDDPFYIGGHFVPVTEMKGSIQYCGASRSGKTLQLKPSMATAIASVRRRGADRRVVLTDAKQDMLPMVAALTKRIGVPFYYFNITDRRSIAYHIAEDIGGRSDKAREAALQMIPTPRTGDAYWSQTAQALFHAGTLTLNQDYGTEWGLHDLYSMALMSIPQLIEFLSRNPVGRMIAQKYLPEDVGENTKFGFISQLTSSLNQIELAAAAQYYTPKSRWLSMSKFLRSEAVLLFGTSTDTRQATNPIFQLAFRNLVSTMNLYKDSPTKKTFTFLDELPFWGKLNALQELLTFSPSKGAVTSLVFQDINHVIDIYGEKMALTISGNCQTSLLFAPASTASAEWSVHTLGKHEFPTSRFSTNFSSSGISESESVGSEYAYPMTDGELRNLGFANPRTGSRFVLNPMSGRPFIKSMTAQEIERWKPESGNTQLLVPRPPHEYSMPAEYCNLKRSNAFLAKTLSSQQIEEQYLSTMKPGSREQQISKQMFKVLRHVLTKQVREYNEFRQKQE